MNTNVAEIVDERTLFGVPPHMVDQYWGEASYLLKKALDRADGKYSLDSIYNSVMSGDFQLWIVLIEGEMMMAGITQIIIYPTKKVCTVMFLGGRNLYSLQDSYHIFESWAKSVGCSSIEIWGRKSWQRIMKDYDLIHIVLRKEL